MRKTEFNIILNEVKIVEIFIFEIILIINDSPALLRTRFVFRKNSKLGEI
jgi:hypothetical protein